MATFIGTDANNNITYQVEPADKQTMLPNTGTAKFQDEIAKILETVTTYRGQPVVVTAAEDMTDETVIYLYMGDEEGYNADHWYYYDTENETWTDGGAYVANPVTIDDTLTQAGEAADAKATGDAINDVKADFNKLSDSALFKADDNGYIIQFDAVGGTPITVNPPTTAGKLVHCKQNLFNQAQFLRNTNIVYADGYYNGMGSYFTSVISSLTLPKFEPYKTYVVKFTAYASANMQFKFGWVYDNNTTRWSSAVNTSEATIEFSSMPSAYKQTGNGRTVVGFNFTYSSSGRIYIKDFQITESRDALDYEAFSGTMTDFEANSDDIELTAFDGLNTIYCSSGACEVNYYRPKIGECDGLTVVCLGDSVTGNYTAPTDYPYYMAKKTGLKAINGGFGGTRMSLHTDAARQYFSFCSLADSIAADDFSAQYTAAHEIGIYNVYEHIHNLESVDWSKVDYLVVFYGTNDFTAQVPIDNQSDPDDTSTYIGAFRYGVEKILTEYPNVRILAVTPMYRYFPDQSTDSDSQQYGGKYLYEFGNALIEACKEYKTPSLDMYYLSGVNAITREYYLEDDTHPSVAGRKNIGSIIGDKIASAF